MVAITKEEAAKWLAGMTEDAVVNMLLEHHTLKQHLCAQVLAIPTGADDWVRRAISKATNLRECERQLTRVVRTGLELLEDARWKAHEVTCSNCMGSGRTQGHPCPICNGTGARAI